MKKLNIISSIVTGVLVSFLFAGMLATARAQAQANAQQPDMTLTVNPTDIQSIGKGLGMLPYADVAALMQKLQSQINTQAEKAKAAETKAEEKK